MKTECLIFHETKLTCNVYMYNMSETHPEPSKTLNVLWLNETILSVNLKPKRYMDGMDHGMLICIEHCRRKSPMGAAAKTKKCLTFHSVYCCCHFHFTIEETAKQNTKMLVNISTKRALVTTNYTYIHSQMSMCKPLFFGSVQLRPMTG